MSYTTIQGDMWDFISYKIYGKCKYADILMAANPEYITVYKFSAGAVLDCPEIETVTKPAQPPWKQVRG